MCEGPIIAILCVAWESCSARNPTIYLSIYRLAECLEAGTDRQLEACRRPKDVIGRSERYFTVFIKRTLRDLKP